MLVLDVTSFVISSVIMSFRELFLLFCTLTGQTFHRLAPSRITSSSGEDNDHEDEIEELDLSAAFEEVSSEEEETEEEEEPCSNRLELECPVCLEVSHGNIYQCTRGHLICLDCAKKVARCPMCRELYKRPMTRNVVAEDLVRGQRGWNCHYLAELDLSCISCGEVPTGRIHQCWWGDLICRRCLRGRKTCPRSNCREKYRDRRLKRVPRNLVAERARERLNQMRCD